MLNAVLVKTETILSRDALATVVRHVKAYPRPLPGQEDDFILVANLAAPPLCGFRRASSHVALIERGHALFVFTDREVRHATTADDPAS